MAKALNETDRIVSGILIVVGAFGHEAGRFVFLQLSDMRSPPSNEHKKIAATIIGATFRIRGTEPLGSIPGL